MTAPADRKDGETLTARHDFGRTGFELAAGFGEEHCHPPVAIANAGAGKS